MPALEKLCERSASRDQVALQINMHASDFRHVVHSLPHQIRQWHGQVDRVIITIDDYNSPAGRYRMSDYEASRSALRAFVKEVSELSAKISYHVVDYSETGKALARSRFFPMARTYPSQAFDGGPFHAYFHGMAMAGCRYVLHIDSDMLFGGGSQTWIAEAIAWLEKNPDLVFVSPLPGPPRHDGELAPEHTALAGVSGLPVPVRVHAPYPAYRFKSISTRVLLVDLERLASAFPALDVVAPSPIRQLKSVLFGHDPASVPAEEVLTQALLGSPCHRLDFLGHGAGMYSLHPPLRSAEFYAGLPDLIARIEAGDVPDAQRGHYDITDAMFDWTTAREGRTFAHRARKAAINLIANNLARLARWRGTEPVQPNLPAPPLTANGSLDIAALRRTRIGTH